MHALTDEQQAIVGSDASQVRVTAYAGTGKTSTLAAWAAARPQQNILYLAYNKSVQQEAIARFTPNVRAVTTHALAFASHGRPYAGKLGNMRTGDIAKCLRLSYPVAALIATTLNNFLTSADESIGPVHLPAEAGSEHDRVVAAVLDGTRTIWRRMCDVDDAAVPMSHDGYLRLFVLSEPDLRTDAVLMDEAQDANGIVTRLVARYRGRKLIVGDHHQAIYQWRGARDALNEFRGAREFALTHSFRFGSHIADAANALLDYLGDSRRIIGAGPDMGGQGAVDHSQPYAFIARTNMTLIQAAIQTLAPRLRAYYVGGIENTKLGLLEDGYHLLCHRKASIRDRFVRSFDSIAALAEYAKLARDVEMALLCQLTLTYAHEIPGLLARLRALAVSRIDQADRIFTTAHKSKGLQFRQVVLADDFIELVRNGRRVPRHEIDIQQVNLLYVAATRATHCLDPGAPLRAFLECPTQTPLLDQVSALPRRTASAEVVQFSR